MGQTDKMGRLVSVLFFHHFNHNPYAAALVSLFPIPHWAGMGNKKEVRKGNIRRMDFPSDTASSLADCMQYPVRRDISSLQTAPCRHARRQLHHDADNASE